ncbi:FtsX-like permease family protein [Lysinibacillus sp. NPDC093216]|uniref:FtsX-like permease family protein n=1 Tax=Lysinibacillus sp. NPDC093216 TaxID=3390576 RepID=UPI003D017624
MTFKQVVWKMAKVHYKKYLLYLVCNSFVVMFFFMFSTLYFNKQIEQVKKLESLDYVLNVPAIALIVFMIFFITYAHGTFIKRRKSEFGLFITLGMTNRDISKLLLLENAIIAFLSIVIGLLSGGVFSRLFFLLLMNSVGLEEIAFQLNSKMLYFPIITFIIIYFFAIGKSLYLILNRNLIQSLKSNKVAESIKLKSPKLGVFGLILIIGSVLGLFITYIGPHAGEFLYIWFTITTVGLYLCLSQFMSFFIELAKQNNEFFYRQLLLLTSIDYKFKQFTSILMMVTMMIMITILYSTIILTTYTLNEKEVLNQNPFDIAFLQPETKDNLSIGEFDAVLNNKENPVQKHIVIPLYSYYDKTYDGWYNLYNIMTVDHFNALTSREVILQGREYLHYLNVEPEYAGDANEDILEWTIPSRKGNITYSLKKSIIESNINSLLGVSDFIIVSNSEFEFLKANVHGFASNLHLINVVSWKETTKAVKGLEERYNNEKTPSIVDVRGKNVSQENPFKIASKIGGHYRNIHSNGMLFFVMTFLSIIFFFGSFILVYLNLFSEIDKEQVKYQKLYNIGITATEVKRMISREMKIIFFISTLAGMGLAFLYVISMANDVGGVIRNPEILWQFFSISGIYLIIQIGFYLYTRRKMFSHLSQGK